MSRVGRIDGERRGGGCDQTRLISARRTDDCGDVGLSGWHLGYDGSGSLLDAGLGIVTTVGVSTFVRLERFWTFSEIIGILVHPLRRPRVGQRGRSWQFGARSWSLTPAHCAFTL